MARENYHKCPVCEKFYFTDYNSYDVCPVCGWIDDAYQADFPDEWGLGNLMNLNYAREQYKKGNKVR